MRQKWQGWRDWSRQQWLIIGLFVIYLYVYPWSIILTALDQVPAWGTGMGAALLILQGGLLWLWLGANYGRRGLLAGLLIVVVSWAIEHIGVITGFPFGGYVYTDVLNWKIAGVVPLAVPFAWLLVVPAAAGVTEWLLRRSEQARLSRKGQPTPTDETMQTLFPARPAFFALLTVMGVASFALLLDVALEPVAVHIKGYWIWTDTGNGGFYGVPASNFAAWWATSFLLASILYVLVAPVRRRGPLVCAWLPMVLYLLNLLMFVLVNLAYLKLDAAAIGGLVLLCVAFAWLEPYLVRWITGHDPDR